MARKNICRRPLPDATHSTLAGAYSDPVQVLGVDRLPARASLGTEGDRGVVQHGFAVNIYGHEWDFFEALAPAYAFARAARMGAGCSGFALHAAAIETLLCTDHGENERLLHLGEAMHLRTTPAELDVLKEFVAGVRANPNTSSWLGTRPQRRR